MLKTYENVGNDENTLIFHVKTLKNIAKYKNNMYLTH